MKLSVHTAHILLTALCLTAANVTTGCAFEGEAVDDVEGASEDALSVDVTQEFLGRYKLAAGMDATQEMTRLDLISNRRYTLQGAAGREHGTFVVLRGSSGDKLRLTTASGARRTYWVTLAEQDGRPTLSFRRYSTTFSLVRFPEWLTALASSDRWGVRFANTLDAPSIGCMVSPQSALISCGRRGFEQLSSSFVSAPINDDGSFSFGAPAGRSATRNVGADSLAGTIHSDGTVELTSFRSDACPTPTSQPLCTSLNHGVSFPARAPISTLCYAPGHASTRYPYSRLSGWYQECSTCDQTRRNVFGDDVPCTRFPSTL